MTTEAISATAFVQAVVTTEAISATAEAREALVTRVAIVVLLLLLLLGEAHLRVCVLVRAGLLLDLGLLGVVNRLYDRLDVRLDGRELLCWRRRLVAVV